MKKSSKTAARRRSPRTDTRTLLRSRPFQALLVAVAGAQVMAVASGKGLHQEQPRTLRQLAAEASAPAPVVRAVTPVAAMPPLKTRATAAESVRKPGEAKKPSVSARAEELASKYRRRGYKVSPALARQIHAAAVDANIDPTLAFGLVRTESAFRNSATSPVGAIGLTQLMPATARWLERGTTRSDLRNPEVNLRIGFRYLRSLIDRYEGDTDLALLAYNRGPGTVDRVLKRGGNPDNGYADMVKGRRNTHR